MAIELGVSARFESLQCKPGQLHEMPLLFHSTTGSLMSKQKQLSALDC
jgi:hypothetical protein